VLFVLLIIIAIASFFGLRCHVGIKTTLEIMPSIILVLVTVVYVKKTRDIAVATRMQADINETLLKANNTPLLTLRNIGGFLNTKSPSLEYTLLLKNVGKGAIDIIELDFYLTLDGYDSYNKGWEEKMVKSGVIKDGAIKIDSTNGNIFHPSEAKKNMYMNLLLEI